MKSRTLFVPFLLFLVFGSCFFPSASAKPYWLKEGFSATYRIKADKLITEIIKVEDHEVHCTALLKPNGTYRWEVKALSGSYAEVEVDVDLVALDYKRQVVKWNRTTTVQINVDNRDTKPPNGTDLGKIDYWIDPNVQQWDKVVVYGTPPNEINGTVQNYKYNPVKTPAGEFDCWLIIVTGDRPDLGIPADLHLYYDKATGLLVAADMFYYDVVLMLMGAVELSIFSGDCSFVLESSTMSSPSSPQFLNLLDYLPYIVAAIAVTAIPTAVYLTRRKRKKTHVTE